VSSTPRSHTTVLLSEAVRALLDNQVEGAAAHHYVDATFGRGGHSRALLAHLPPSGSLTVFDRDPEAVAVAQALAAQDTRVQVRHAAFSGLAEMPAASVAGLLMDVGVSSPQIDTPERGFSFRHDGPLDMRMDTTRGATVAQWLASASVQQITDVIRDYGEERFAYPIAQAIAKRREQGPALTTTGELQRLVATVVKTREPGQDPATRTFQALRIHINAELDELQRALSASLRLLAPAGRLVVISFHSLEDRIVKQFMAAHSREVVDRRHPAYVLQAAVALPLKLISRIKPSAAEVAANPRARSAVMRVAQRTSVPLSGAMQGAAA
jgi:16S rRNA (cytosine1402-N4)-methyltransferase